MTLVDGIVIGTILLFGIVAMYLGFIRVVSGLGGWIGAAAVTVYGFEHVRPVARGWISDTLIADAAAGLTLFVVALILFSFVSHAISSLVRESGLRPVDRSAGFAIGLVLGVVAICAVFLLFDKGSQDRDRPKWMREARTTPLVERTSYFLWSYLPRSWRDDATGLNGARALGRDQGSRRAEKELITPLPKTGSPTERRGYSEKEREEMDRLLRGQ